MMNLRTYFSAVLALSVHIYGVEAELIQRERTRSATSIKRICFEQAALGLTAGFGTGITVKAAPGVGATCMVGGVVSCLTHSLHRIEAGSGDEGCVKQICAIGTYIPLFFVGFAVGCTMGEGCPEENRCLPKL